MKKIIIAIATVVSMSAFAQESSSYQPTPVGDELNNFDLRDVPRAGSNDEESSSVYGPPDEELVTIAREECQQNKSYRICQNIRPPSQNSEGRNVCTKGEEIIDLGWSNVSLGKIKEHRPMLAQLTERARGNRTYFGPIWCIPTN